MRNRQLYHWKSIVLLLLVAVSGSVAVAQSEYPARCHTSTDLNVRSGAGTNYGKIGLLRKGESITVLYLAGPESKPWGAIDYGTKRGYVSMKYVCYDEAIAQTPAPAKENAFVGFLKGVWNVVKWILIVIGVIIGIFLFKYIVQIAVFAGMFAGGGAILFLLFGGDAGAGAIVGLVVAAILGVGWLFNYFDVSFTDVNVVGIFRGIFMGAYYLVSFPVYFLNRLEHFLVSPWRYFFKENWPLDRTKPTWRVVTEAITVVMYIATTPLRLLNAIIYNIFIHCITGIYDLLLEVLAPSDDKEGARDVWTWIYMLPFRVAYYALWHSSLMIVESVIWTVVDIFIPARTFYHGTNLNAGLSIVCDPHRNRHLKNVSKWSSGNFLASSDENCSWAGKGVYFAIQRGLALAYSGSNRSGRGGDAVMIACRVSVGRVISYALMPDNVYAQAGGGGRHGEINEFAEKNNYTTGEWYNPRGVWEYCLFDWQEGYNDPWRIRPIYMLNLRTGRAQHISGGMQHWLFDKGVLKNLGF